jgi:hypothetical protein
VQQSWPARLRSGPEEDPAHDGTGFLPTFSQVGSLSRTCQWSQQLEKIPILVIFSTLNIPLILLCIISLKFIRCKLDSIIYAGQNLITCVTGNSHSYKFKLFPDDDGITAASDVWIISLNHDRSSLFEYNWY